MTTLPIIQAANDNGRQACTPLRANLSVASCGRRHVLAQEDHSGQFKHCAKCEHGARNASTA